MKEFLKKIWITFNHPVCSGIIGLLDFVCCGYIFIEYCYGSFHLHSFLFGIAIFVATGLWGCFCQWFFDRLFMKKEA